MDFIHTTAAFIIVIIQSTRAQALGSASNGAFSQLKDNNFDMEYKWISSSSDGSGSGGSGFGAGTVLTMPNKMAKCPSGYFHCDKTWQCVQQHLNCDGKADCDDASDELNCSNEADNKYWDHLFRKQPYGHHDDKPIEECAWPLNGVNCLCRDNDILCRFLNLTSLPSNFEIDSLDMLDLTGNNFKIIDEHFFEQMPVAMESLILKSCSINHIRPRAFQRLKDIELKTLYLDENSIEELLENVFPLGNQLKVLVLSGNRIRYLHSYTFRELLYLEELDLRANKIENFEANVFENLVNLEKLYLNDNIIKYVHVGMFPEMKSLHILSLAQNKIADIEAYSFILPNLQELFLAVNYLVVLNSQTFCPLQNLKGLHLNENMLEHIELHAFDCLDNLTSLLLTDNKFYALESRIFENLTNLNYIYFSWFHLCRAALHVRVCEPKTDGISSFHNLLDNPIQRAAVWFMTLTAIVGNILVIIGRCFYTTRRNGEHSLYLRHLAFSDLIMGIYLAIVAIQDIRFRDNYILHDAEWRGSFLCEIAGFLNTLSCESSTLLLTLVTWDRLMSVTRPLQPRDISKCKVIVRLIVLWGISFALAIAPLLPILYFGANFYRSNSVCLSLYIHDPYAQGWEYSVFLFVVLNSISVLFISVSYMKMLQTIINSGESLRSTASGRHNVILTTRFAIIVITDCVCWLPVIVVKLFALGGFRIPLDLYAWLAVLVLPMNSALNPILYTLTTKAFKQQLSSLCFQGNSSLELRTQTGESGGMNTSITNFGSMHTHSIRSPSRQRSTISR